MLTLQTKTHVDRLKGEQVFDFLVNADDHEYQAWWPGVHLQLHTLKRFASNIGNIVFMEEYIGEYRVKSTSVLVEAIPSRRLVWQSRKGIRLPVRLSLEMDDDQTGVTITHTIRVGFQGPGSVLDIVFRAFFSAKFTTAIQEHVKTEFPKLRNLLARTHGTRRSPSNRSENGISGG